MHVSQPGGEQAVVLVSVSPKQLCLKIRNGYLKKRVPSTYTDLGIRVVSEEVEATVCDFLSNMFLA
jgi:hypothetical protein